MGQRLGTADSASQVNPEGQDPKPQLFDGVPQVKPATGLKLTSLAVGFDWTAEATPEAEAFAATLPALYPVCIAAE